MSNQKEVFPIFDKVISKELWEQKLKQKAKVLWFTGLSGAGKTTLALALEKKLFKRGFYVKVLDGDNIRSGINNNLGFTESERKENIRRIAEISKLFLNTGFITINAFISPTKEIRDMARDIIGKENYLEIFVNASLAVCEKRDTKGLYKKAREGKIKNFTGIDSPYEAPKDCYMEINTDLMSIEESVEKLTENILRQIEV